LRILSDATNVIAEGEVLQLMNSGNPDVTEATYLDVIRRKTAKLFEAAAQIGAVLGGADAASEDALARYGMKLGTAFQLIDDVLDYSGDLHETGKNLGDDLNEGKPTLPLIYAMRKGSRAQAQTVRHAIEHGGRDDFEAVLEAITDTGALEYAREQARREAAVACAAIELLPNSKYRESLLQLADFAVNRNH
jgi:octaprenyl-diphosphate synthase